MGLLTNDMWRGFPTTTQLIPGGSQALPNFMNQPMGKFSQLAYQLAGSPAQKPGAGILLGPTPSGSTSTPGNFLSPGLGAGLLGVGGVATGLSKALNPSVPASTLGGATTNFPSSPAPIITDTPIGTTTQFPDATDALGPVTPTVSKIPVAGAGNLVSSPKNALGAAGDLYGIYGGLDQGGTQGYGSAIAAGANLAGLAGYGGTATGAIGAAGNLAAGNYLGAAKSIGGLLSGTGTAAAGSGAAAGGTAAGAGSAAAGTAGSGASALGGALGAAGSLAGAAGVVLAVAPYLKKGFDGGATTLRNDSQWLADTGAKSVTLARGLSVVKLPDGRLLTGDQVKALSDKYWRAAFEGGDPKAYYDLLDSTQGMKGNFNPNAKAIVSTDTTGGNIYGRLPGKP